MNQSRCGSPPRAFSLLELIGVLAVLAILAAVLIPALLRQMDKVAGDQESASLKSFGDAFQQSVLRNRAIPTYTTMASNIATELGVGVSTVSTNARKQARVFLIDPSLQVGANGLGLPYTQTNAGSVVTNGSGIRIPPVNPRIMILSSIGTNLPIASGIPSSADFTNIWDTADGTVPTAAPAFLNWPGTGADLKIQRVNLSPLFVRLQLIVNGSTNTPRYSVDATNWATATPVLTSPAIDAYFIQNSVLTLHTHNATIDSQQILTRDKLYFYNQNVWQGGAGIGAFLVQGLDVASVVDQFLRAPPNPRAQNGAGQQALVVANMQAYIDAYNSWAASGFPHVTNGNKIYPPSGVSNAQIAMVSAVQGLYLQSGGWNPTNVPCPQ